MACSIYLTIEQSCLQGADTSKYAVLGNMLKSNLIIQLILLSAAVSILLNLYLKGRQQVSPYRI